MVQPYPNLHDDETAKVPSCNWILRKTTVGVGQGYEDIAVVDGMGLQVGLVELRRRRHRECRDEVCFCYVVMSAWFRSSRWHNERSQFNQCRQVDLRRLCL